MSDAEIRDKKLERLKRDVDPVRTAEQASAQTTTDSYALVDESKIQPAGREHLSYIVEETGGSNGVDARIVKRNKNAAGNWGGWVPDDGSDAEETNISADGVQDLKPSDTEADEYGVEIKANTGGSQGDVKVTGVARAGH